jgi:hypothetical protein
MDPAEPGLGIPNESVDRVPIPDVAAARVHTHPHRHEGGLGQQRLLGDVPAREVDIAEPDVAPDAGELQRNGATQPGRPAGDDGDLALESFGDRLRLLLFGHGTRAFRFFLPGRSVPVPEEWQRHGRSKVRRLGRACKGKA